MEAVSPAGGAVGRGGATHHMRTWILTAATMLCFAANSLLARLALREGEIDGGGFTAIRIASGALVLSLLVGRREGGLGGLRRHGSWSAAAAMFAYAITFSLAYRSLDAGVGALILFGAVQITMIAAGMISGERPAAVEWAGLCLALGGLACLVSPGSTAPSLPGTAMMATAGFFWGRYSLAARGVASATAATASNFLRAAPMAIVALPAIWAVSGARLSGAGVGLAMISGGVTSGLGYVIWYAALKGLSASRAAIVQLTVPVLTALAGVAFLGERMTWRLALCAVAILSGVALALRGRR